MADELELDLSYEGEEGAYAEHEEEIDYAQSDDEKAENGQGNGVEKAVRDQVTDSKSAEGGGASEDVSGDSSREYRRGGDGYSGEYTSLDERRGPASRENNEDRWQRQQAHGGQRRGRGEHYRPDRRLRQDRYVNEGGHDGYWQGSRAHMQRSPPGYQAPVRPPPPPPPENGRAPMPLASTGPEPMMNMYQQQQLLLRQQKQRMAGLPMDAYASNVVRQPMGIPQEPPGYSPPGIHSHLEYQCQGPMMNRGYRGRGRGWQGEGPSHQVRQLEQSFEGSHQGGHPLKPTKVTDGKDLSLEGQDTSRNVQKMEEDEKQKKLAAIRALREEQAAKNRELAEKRRKKIEEINAAEEIRRKRAESIAAAKAAALRKRNEDLQSKRDVLLAQKEAELQMLRQKLAEKTRQRESSSDEAAVNESQAKKQKMEEGSVIDGGHLEDDVKQDLKA